MPLPPLVRQGATGPTTKVPILLPSLAHQVQCINVIITFSVTVPIKAFAHQSLPSLSWTYVCINITFCTLEMQFYRIPIPTWPHLGSTFLRKLKASLIWWWQRWEELAQVHLCALLDLGTKPQRFQCFCDLDVFLCVFCVLAIVQNRVIFYLFLLIFSTKMKNELQPTRAAI